MKKLFLPVLSKQGPLDGVAFVAIDKEALLEASEVALAGLGNFGELVYAKGSLVRDTTKNLSFLGFLPPSPESMMRAESAFFETLYSDLEFSQGELVISARQNPIVFCIEEKGRRTQFYSMFKYERQALVDELNKEEKRIESLRDRTEKMLRSIDEFTRAYLECAFWSSTTDEDKPLDDDYSPSDLDPESLSQIIEECSEFQKEFGDELTGHRSFSTQDGRVSSEEMAGHDFWLTRNEHGCGFWDGDWGESLGEKMDEFSKKVGNRDLYVGDDGLVYMYPMK